MPWLTRLSRKPTAAARASGSGPDGPATLRHSSPATTPASTLLTTTIMEPAVNSTCHQGLAASSALCGPAFSPVARGCTSRGTAESGSQAPRVTAGARLLVVWSGAVGDADGQQLAVLAHTGVHLQVRAGLGGGLLVGLHVQQPPARPQQPGGVDHPRGLPRP